MWLPQLIVILLLLWGYNPNNPYMYYIILRWVCSTAFIYLSIYYLATAQIGWGLIFGVALVIYNPIIWFTGTRMMWSIINFITIIVAIASIFGEKQRK